MPVLPDGYDSLRCPTCRARQTLSAECRRCKCDLTLMAAVLGRGRGLHAEVLVCLREGRYDDALRAARQRFELSPDETAARLLAVCYLRLDRFQAALDVYDSLGA